MCDEDSEVVRSSPLTAKGLNGISVSGSGDVDVEALESERFEVSVSGTGNLDIARGAIGDQDIKISGSGSVRYVGQPEIHSAVSNVGVNDGLPMHDPSGRNEMEETRMTGNGSNGHALIDLRGVFKSYHTGAGEVPVLKDINLKVTEGEFVSVVGPSGSGKSTMLNMITGIDRPTDGRVMVAGEAVHTMSENQLARWRGKHVGVIFQFFQLLPTLTIVENVMLPMDFCNVYKRRRRKARAMALLDMVSIADQAHKLPNALSGGQQQRAAIARALANDPPVLVGDEPTGNLDTHTAAEVFKLFDRLVKQGKTLVIVTHDLHISEQTGRVIHLLDGRLHRDEANGRGK